ncbi:Rab family GTPase, partial [Paraglaciecola sp.]|uniref:Rab family GTPase n=1 Tax=Paraglaciecola sp. TaxID=1920173 RepID=UPI003EF6BE19
MIQKKICILGASGVGKTSLIKQYVEGIFSEKYLTSIGVKIDKKIVELDSSSVQLMIWDIEGIDNDECRSTSKIFFLKTTVS